ncbi:hypothetical protein R1sor_019038 [Riccia sorocarpa]|uniref:Probable threonine--tRNA ligase, cytoplasmic n=1 Tax=Riccia sorocarpa TaxID=122646 RepID=A0ABD3IBZ0_9MARC
MVDFSAPSEEQKLVEQKRMALFEQIQAEQRKRREELGGGSIRITLPDGNVKEGQRWFTTSLDIAREISKALAERAVVAEVNGVLWDMGRALEGDCSLKLFTFDSNEGRDTFWHSSAHILGEGFYYDAYYGDLTLNEDHFTVIAKQVDKAVKEKQAFERIEVTRQQALEIFAENKFKVELIRELPEDEVITIYKCGRLVDLCRGPHIPSTSHIKAFLCLKASASHWRGQTDRESLQRVYGISFPDKKDLKEWLTLQEEAKQRDHRIVGLKQQLFFFHPLSPGTAFFSPYGTRIYNKLIEFIRTEYKKRGYEEVISPSIFNMQLWELSGHAANYKEHIFCFEVEKQEFGLKPMNCPGHCLLFDHSARSYRDLPCRMAEFGLLHRNEFSGALTGLTRVRGFKQDDAHIFCMESQIKEEVKGCLDFLEYAYNIFGFTYSLGLSTRSTWETIEHGSELKNSLREALEAFGKPWKFNHGDGAFYGPKIDITVCDAFKRTLQCATIQLDFQLPIRFKLQYSTGEGKVARPVVVHRAVLGSVERMFAVLLLSYLYMARLHVGMVLEKEERLLDVTFILDDHTGRLSVPRERSEPCHKRSDILGE